MIEEDRLYEVIIVWQGSIRGVWSFARITNKKKTKIFYIFLKNLFFSDAVAVCHLLDMVEEDRLYNPIIVWQGSIRGVWSFSKITIKKKIDIFLYIFQEFFFRSVALISPIG